MKISTWNLWASNNHQKKSIDFLLSHHIDIMCVQELNTESLNYLQSKTEYHVQHAVDYYCKNNVYYNAVISKKLPLRSSAIRFKTILKPSLLSYMFHRQRGVAFLYNNYAISDTKTLRVFNAHLNVDASPHQRFAQLEEIYTHFSFNEQTYNVICGDLNSYARIPLNFIIGPIFRFAMRDYKTSELKALANLIDTYNLKFGLKKTTTFPLLHMHLDHILIPKLWNNYSTKVYRKRKGSDHRLVVLDVDI